MSDQDNLSEELEDDDYQSPLSSGTVEDEDDFSFDEETIPDDEALDLDETGEDGDTVSVLSSGVVEDSDAADVDDEALVEDDVDDEANENEVAHSAELDTVTDDAELTMQELSRDEAVELTEHIRSTTDVLYVLVARAHAGKAHKVLGYSNFGEYVKAEFNISKSRAYQFINQSEIIKAIEQATPDGTQFKLNEAAARDLKHYMDELAPAIRDRTEGMNPEDAGEVVEDMIDEYRDSLKNGGDDLGDFDLDSLDLDSIDLDSIEIDMPDFGGGGGEGGGGSQFDGQTDFDSLDKWDGDAFGDLGDVDSADGSSAERRRVDLEQMYNFYSAISTLEGMGDDVEKIVSEIQSVRVNHFNKALPKAKLWFDKFYEAYAEKHFVQDGSNNTDESEELNLATLNTEINLEDIDFSDLDLDIVDADDGADDDDLDADSNDDSNDDEDFDFDEDQSKG